MVPGHSEILDLMINKGSLRERKGKSGPRIPGK